MSETSVGTIRLDLEINAAQALDKQISNVSENVAKRLKGSIEKTVNKSDLSSAIGKSFSTVGKKTADVFSKIGQDLSDRLKKATTKSTDSINKALSTVESNASQSVNAASGTKVGKGINKQDLVNQRGNSINLQENINAQIASLHDNLKKLQNMQLDGTVTDDMLKIESRIISLTDKSDRLTTNIRNLDDSISAFDTNQAAEESDDLAKKQTRLGNVMNRLGSVFKKNNDSMKNMNVSTKKAQRPLINMRSIGASLARNFLGLQLLISVVGQGIRKMAQSFMTALKSNDQFSSSLNQIKSNLATAFQPIYEAILPAINSLMSALSKASAYLATFISALFGKTVDAANASAKAMANATAETQRMTAGFDQLNDITADKNSDSTSIVSVDIDESSISKIKAFAEKVKVVIDKIKEFFKPIGDIIGWAFEQISGAIKKLSENKPFMEFLTRTLLTIGVALLAVQASALLVPLAIAGIVVAIAALINNWDECWKAVKKIWAEVKNWFSTSVVDPVKNLFSNLWSSLKMGSTNAWSGIKDVFGSVSTFFKDTFTKAWTAVKNVFSSGGKIFDGIKDGIVTAFKTIVNAIINGVNKVVSIPFNAINATLKKVKSISIFGVKPFDFVGTISVPTIPTLASGGILKEPTLNLAGEYPGASSNPEIVTPQSLMAETFKSVLKDFLSEMKNNNQTSNQTVQLIVNIGGKKLLDQIIQLADEYQKQTGRSVFYV